MIMLGGLDRTGSALGDLWYMDVEDSTEGIMFVMTLSNITAATWTSSHVQELYAQITKGFGVADGKPGQGKPSTCSSRSVIIISETVDVPEVPKSIMIVFSTTQQVFDN